MITTVSGNVWLTSLWLLATLEVSLALYLLILNLRNWMNVHLAGMMLIYAVNTFALGLLVSAQDIETALLPMVLLSMSSVPVIAITWIVNMLLLFHEPPRWLRYLNYVMYLGIAVPIVSTLIDIIFGTKLWLNISTEPYPGGYVGGGFYGDGIIGSVMRLSFTYIVGLATSIPPLVAMFQRKQARSRRSLAIVLFVVQVLIIVLQAGLNNVISSEMSVGLVNVLFALVYGYITFNMSLTMSSMQRGRLQTRLTLLSLVVTVPVLILVSFTVARTGQELLTDSAKLLLESTGRTISSNIESWLNEHVNALQFLSTQPDILSMDPAQQKAALERMSNKYPYIYLVSTTDLNGINIARSDGEDPKDYSDRVWVREAVNGNPVTFQILIGRTSGEPSLVVSVPIRDEAANILGVAMFAATLEDLTASVQSIQGAGAGLDYYVVDDNNQLILESVNHASHTHETDDEHDEGLHEDENEFVVVRIARTSGTGLLRYRETDGTAYLAYTEELSNGWLAVVEQDEGSLVETSAILRNNNAFVLVISVALLVALIYFTVRQALRPIQSLTSTVGAIIEGDLTQRAPIESEDELGVLAESFNTMTDRLNETIDGLEERVQSRTAVIEQRSRYLQASSEVARAASTILDSEELLRESVDLIRERFGLYYVGLFLVDKANEWAVLRAGTGSAGQIMLARDHRILIGTGMVGWSVANKQARITSHAEEDTVRLSSSELPDTRSEAALPLTSRGVVLGALTVQSTQLDFFDEDTVTVLQTMADQIAVAIDNASLYTSMQETLDTERRAFGRTITRSIQDAGGGANDWVYDRNNGIFEKPMGDWQPAMLEARRKAGAVVMVDPDAGRTLAVPIKVRNEVVGVLDLQRASDVNWTPQEIALLETITEQLGAALESALLYENSLRRASREQMIRQITENISAASTVEDAMQRAIQALAEVANARQVAVKIGSQQMLSAQRGDGYEN